MFGTCGVHGATLYGVKAVHVDVEVVVCAGLPSFSIVGMPDAPIQEARERIRAAIKACGYSMPGDKVVVNLAPGSLRKSGSGFDLPIAVALLIATGQVDPRYGEGRLFVGELSLEGSVRPVPGLLAYGLCARSSNLDLVCAQAPDQIVTLEGLSTCCIKTLADFRAESLIPIDFERVSATPDVPDFADIAGHSGAKRVLQIAAAGDHGVLMIGPPGSGKTMLASRLPSILPPLSEEESLEAAVIHSVVGEDAAEVLAGYRPFRAPHHCASGAGLLGGGSPPRPGEVSLAHCGVLFLDELSEFKPSVLQGIRQPLEAGQVSVTRADGNVVFPAKFSLIAASNPCPCGYFGDSEIPCTCSLTQVQRYQNRIGGPILDRIDLRIDVHRILPSEVLSCGKGVDSDTLRDGVLRAREFARWRRLRFAEDKHRSTGVSSKVSHLVAQCNLSAKDREYFEDIAQRSSLSGRGIMRTLSVARTIADMEESDSVSHRHLCEALQYRLSDGMGER